MCVNKGCKQRKHVSQALQSTTHMRSAEFTHHHHHPDPTMPPITRTVILYPTPELPQMVGAGDSIDRLQYLLEQVKKRASKNTAGETTARIRTLTLQIEGEETIAAHDFAAMKGQELAHAVKSLTDNIGNVTQEDAQRLLAQALARFNRTTWE